MKHSCCLKPKTHISGCGLIRQLKTHCWNHILKFQFFCCYWILFVHLNMKLSKVDTILACHNTQLSTTEYIISAPQTFVLKLDDFNDTASVCPHLNICQNIAVKADEFTLFQSLSTYLFGQSCNSMRDTPVHGQVIYPYHWANHIMGSTLITSINSLMERATYWHHCQPNTYFQVWNINWTFFRNSLKQFWTVHTRHNPGCHLWVF